MELQKIKKEFLKFDLIHNLKIKNGATYNYLILYFDEEWQVLKINLKNKDNKESELFYGIFKEKITKEIFNNIYLRFFDSAETNIRTIYHFLYNFNFKNSFNNSKEFSYSPPNKKIVMFINNIEDMKFLFLLSKMFKEENINVEIIENGDYFLTSENHFDLKKIAEQLNEEILKKEYKINEYKSLNYRNFEKNKRKIYKN